MTETPDYKTIDFAAYLSGQELPKDTVSVILNEKVGYDAYRLQEAIKGLDPKDDADEIEGLRTLLAELQKTAQASEFTFHLTAVSREDRDRIRTQIREEFEVETDMFGRTKPNAEAEKAYTSRIWALHTELVEGPDGIRLTAPTPENIAGLLAKAPDLALSKIDAKIAELQGSGATEGFEALIQDADFLSQR